MTGGEARALALAIELRDLLGKLCDLPKHGPDSAIGLAWDQMDGVVETLTPLTAVDNWEAAALESWTPQQRSR